MKKRAGRVIQPDIIRSHENALEKRRLRICPKCGREKHRLQRNKVLLPDANGIRMDSSLLKMHAKLRHWSAEPIKSDASENSRTWMAVSSDTKVRQHV